MLAGRIKKLTHMPDKFEDFDKEYDNRRATPSEGDPREGKKLRVAGRPRLCSKWPQYSSRHQLLTRIERAVTPTNYSKQTPVGMAFLTNPLWINC